MVAFHFPPLAGSSGIQRTLRFVQHLPTHGWHPLVLSTRQTAYERTSSDLDKDIPAATVVRRAFAWDAQRHLSIRGRYLQATACPDRWASWYFDGVRQGMAMIRELSPQVIWSTYPIATAHRIAATLSARSGLPWVADFRDPMLEADYPTVPSLRKSFEVIERRTVQMASVCTFTTAGAVRAYQARFPDRAGRMRLLENGYDESSFAPFAELSAVASTPGTRRVWLHSGLIYPKERNPSQLFAALGQLHREGKISPQQMLLRFRAPVHDQLVRHLAMQHGVESFVEVCPPVPYAQALQEMLQADTLLVLQASSCNDQVPAKLYEYFRASRPILGLTDARGDTADVLRRAGIERTADLESAQEIAALFQARLNSSDGFLAHEQAVSMASREHRTSELANWLDLLAAGTE